MSFTSTEEALLRQLLDQQAAILSLAGSESTIISKLGATKVTLADLTAASSAGDADLLLVRQGTTEKSITPLVIKGYIESGISTPPQFDNDTSIATTAFVQRAIGNHAGIVGASTPTTLTAADAGKRIVGTNTTITLPATGTLAIGSAFNIFAYGAGGLTINRSGVDTMTPGGGVSGLTSYFIPSGTECNFVSENGLWEVSGTASLLHASSFKYLQAISGDQYLPSGRIEVQGTFTASATPGNAVSVTFPVSATNFRNLQLTPVSTGTTSIAAWFDTPTGSGFNGRCSVASAVVHYRAIID